MGWNSINWGVFLPLHDKQIVFVSAANMNNNIGKHRYCPRVVRSDTSCWDGQCLQAVDVSVVLAIHRIFPKFRLKVKRQPLG